MFRFLLTAFLLVFSGLSYELSAQASACPSVNAGPDQNICPGQCVNLNATVQGTLQTNTYTGSVIPYSPYSYTTGTPVLVNIDDVWTNAINLPFCFQFFGNTYNQIVIGSNGLISFNVAAYAGGFCQWSFVNPIPTNTVPMNAIMAPYHDIDPSIGSTSDTRYQVYGTAPCRQFVISWYNIPMYSSSCNSMLASQQIVLHEATNIIDIHIGNKPLCTTWNGGRAIEGIQNATGTTAFFVPGRNATQWSATNSSYRFTPAGAPNYTLNWTGPSGSLGSSTTINVCPSTTTTYTATVTNTTCAGNIVVSDQVTVFTTGGGITTTGAQTNITCNGQCSGSATVTITAGTGPFTYAWAPSGGTAATATGLCAGTYTCTISNTAGCTATQTFNITQPPPITATSTQTNVLCNGQCTGAASVTAGGGTGTYTYNWAPSGGTGATATGLCAGTYTVTISSGSPTCTITRTFNITQPTALTATTSFTQATCGNANGSASVSPSGGTPGYTYSWAPSGGTGATATGLAAATYTVTVTDANGCTTTRTVSITNAAGVTATITTSTNVSCFGGNNGSATVSAAGGTSPYTYAWTPSGGTGATGTNLSNGNYTVTVTDVNGCTATATVAITQPPQITLTPTQTNVLCNGASTGSASVVATGGNGTYTYSWAPSGGTGASATGLTAGTYTVTVSSPAGCTRTQTFNITQPTALTASTSFTQATCGNANGSASVSPSGGTPGYTYSWAPSGGTGATATGLVAAIYTVTVTDANGCTTTATVNVANAAGATATITASTNVSCFGGNNGSATVSVAGGTSPFTYAWTPSGGSGATGTNLSNGNYTVTVSDANGCTTTATVAITQPPAITLTPTQTNVLCNGATTGSASVVATGGNGTYTYSWAPSGGTGSTATGLAAGTYTVTVSSPAGCTATQTYNITQPTALTGVATSTAVLCFGGSTGSASVTASGGTAGYTYSWSPSGGTGTSATGLTAGGYTVTITDANGCTTTVSTTVTEPTALTATTSFTQSTCGSPNGSASVTPSGGTSGYTYSWAPSGGTGATATGLAAAIYTVTVTDANGCTVNATANVPNALSPTVTIIASDSVSCFGGNDGYAAASSSGGTTPYTYLWSNNDADTLAGNLTAGSYTVTVTDANGCSSSATVSIGEPPVLTATASGTDLTCNADNSGTANVSGSGGTGAYTYAWSPSGGTSAGATGLAAGTYTCIVTDANGCTTSATTTITEPTALTVASAGFNVSCFGSCDGQLVAIPAGGTPTYSFLWSTGCTNASCNNICAGSYTITITDMNGCTATGTATVTEPTDIVTTTTTVDAHCGLSDGSATASASGGTGVLSYQWISGPANATWNNIPAATYSVVATDANGCHDTVTAVVNNLNGVTIALNTTTNLTCYQSADGNADVDATGGTPGYTYAWSPNVSTSDIGSALAAGNYSVTVTDAAGCTSTVTFTITEPTQLTISAAAAPASVCEGSNVQLSSVPAGGTPGYTVTWNPGALVGATQNIIPPATTTYTVDVTDANGCTATSTTLVTVNSVPVAAIGSDLTAGCAPLCVNFDDLSTINAPGVITSWAWDFGDNNTSTQQNPNHCYNTSGIYNVTLTVTTGNGCSNTIVMNAYIEVYANPVASFTAGPQPTTILNPEITCTDLSVNAASWNWSFGDVANSSSTLQNPSFLYSEPNCYQISLEVISADGCIDTAAQVVCIDPDVIIYIPNAFTPTEDGLNDEFLPVTNGVNPDKYEFWVFDRWGNMIFYTDDLNEGWDGKVLGSDQLCQIDTYVWKIKCTDVLDKRHDLIGHVNLIR